MRHISEITYETFVKEMFANGFDWSDIEFYWRNPDEYERILKEKERDYINSTTSAERDYWDYINNILNGGVQNE